MGVASLVLGSLALVCVLLPFLPTLAGVVLALIGIILGALGRKNAEKRGSATAGMVMSIIALILGILVYVACAACVGGLASM